MLHVTIVLFSITVIYTSFKLIQYPGMIFAWYLIFAPIIDLFWFVKIGSVSLLELYTIWFIVLSVGAIINHRKDFISLGKLWTHFVIISIVMMIPYFINPDVEIMPGIEAWSKLGIGMVAYVVLLNHSIDMPIEKFIKYFRVSIYIYLGTAVFQLITGFGTYYSEYSYLTGMYADEGTLSRIAVYGLIISVNIYEQAIEKKEKLTKYLVLVFSIAVLGLAVSRNAILAAVAVSMFYAISAKKYVVTIVVIATGTLFFVSSDTINENLSRKVGKELRYYQGEKVNVEALGSGRVQRWITAIEEYDSLPFEQILFGTGKTVGPHGQFLELITRYGAFGAIVILLLFYKLTLRAKRAVRLYRDNHSHYWLALLIVFWVLAIGATPLTNHYLLIVIMSYAALYETLDNAQSS